MINVSDRFPSTLKVFRKGERPTAAKLNAPIKAINRMIRGINPPRQNTDGLASVSTPEVKQFRIAVLDTSGDTLTCESYDGTVVKERGARTTIALPHLFRKSPFDDKTRDGITFTYSDTVIHERSATDGTDTETQVVTPSYEVGDVIFAIKNIKNSTGLTITKDVTRPDGSLEKQEVDVEWLDLNVDGRTWAEKNE